MKHAIILGHPDPDSFGAAIAKRYCEAAKGMRHTVVMRDLYRMNFEPRLQLSEMPDRAGWAPAAEIEEERKILADVDVFVFVYPLWFNAPPAIVKGYVDRVFGVGFGYGHLKAGGQEPLLTGRQLLHLTTSGSTTAWLGEQGSLNSIRSLFEDCLARVCGLRVRPHIHFDAIVAGIEARWISRNLHIVEEKVRSYFAGQAGQGSG